MIKILQKLENELKIRGFSQKTVDAYLLQNKLFLEFIKKDPDNITEDDVKSYMAYLMTEKHQKPASISQMLTALRFFYHIILKKVILADIKTPKMEKKLPTVLTKEEVSRLLKGLKNSKHRLLMELMISSGLRVSEACTIKLNDIDFDEKLIHVKSGKGKKDRITIISEKTIENIQKYVSTRSKESEYLFPSWSPEDPISVKLAQKIIKNAMKNAGIKKNLYCHALRSTFATLLLEEGVDIRKIQVLLGHSNLATTERYTKVSTEQLKKIKSPLDNI